MVCFLFKALTGKEKDKNITYHEVVPMSNLKTKNNQNLNSYTRSKANIANQMPSQGMGLTQGLPKYFNKCEYHICHPSTKKLLMMSAQAGDTVRPRPPT